MDQTREETEMATCSNCGEHFELKPGHLTETFDQGFRAVGDALYCPECVKTWEDRNGFPFDWAFRADRLWGNYWFRNIAPKR